MARLDTARQDNRLLDAILFYQSEKISHQVRQPHQGRQDRKGALLDLQYYQALLAANKKNLNPSEKETKAFVKFNIRVLQLKAQPGILNFFLLAFALFSRRFNNVRQQELLVLQAHKAVSIQQSLPQIHQHLQQSGFTQNINPYLQKMMEQGVERFHYRYFDIRHPDTEYILYFSKGKGTDIYHFDRFEAAAIPDWHGISTHKPQYYPFREIPGMQITATEAAHLVNGRAVAVEDTKDQWIQIDKTNLANPYRVIHFDLETALKNTPLPEMNTLEYNQLIQSLRSGDKKELNYANGETAVSYTLQAAPSQQTIYVSDKNGQLINPRDLENRQQSTKAEQFIQQSVSMRQEYTPRMSRV